MATELSGGSPRPAAPTLRQGRLRLRWRPYRFELPRTLVTSQGAWSLRRGWLLRLEDADGRLCWGEAALPPAPQRPNSEAGSDAGSSHQSLQAALDALPAALERQELESRLAGLPAPLACALGMALAELDGLGSPRQGGWLAAPRSALLLPAGEAALAALEQALPALPPEPLAQRSRAAAAAPLQSQGPAGATALTVKWKVASDADCLERRVLETLLERLPAAGRLRLDANGGWTRTTAWQWAERLAEESRLEWLEQPLPPAERQELEALARRLPVALDESLQHDPQLMAGGWRGWQVRRPLLQGDPRPLLAALRGGTPRLMLSTAFETGIGRRLLAHLAGLQALGPTPTAPGLAPGWRPSGDLFSAEPQTVWEAAG